MNPRGWSAGPISSVPLATSLRRTLPWMTPPCRTWIRWAVGPGSSRSRGGDERRGAAITSVVGSPSPRRSEWCPHRAGSALLATCRTDRLRSSSVRSHCGVPGLLVGTCGGRLRNGWSGVRLQLKNEPRSRCGIDAVSRRRQSGAGHLDLPPAAPHWSHRRRWRTRGGSSQLHGARRARARSEVYVDRYTFDSYTVGDTTRRQAESWRINPFELRMIRHVGALRQSPQPRRSRAIQPCAVCRGTP